MGVPVLLQRHYAGTGDEPLQKKVVSKYDLISSPMIQDSVSKKDSNGFPEAVASAVSSMERRELSRCALAARVQHAGPSSATTIDYCTAALPHHFKVEGDSLSVCSPYHDTQPTSSAAIFRYLGLGQVFQAC